MKKFGWKLCSVVLICIITLSLFAPFAHAQTDPTPTPTTAPPARTPDSPDAPPGSGSPPATSPSTGGGATGNATAIDSIPLGCPLQFDSAFPRDYPCPTFTDPDGKKVTTPNCVSSYTEWLKDKRQSLWVYDPEVTALGKGGERSRQFLLWVLTHPSNDSSSNILAVWTLSRNIAYLLLLIIAIFMGIGIIVGQRNNFDLKVEVSPLIIKLVVLLVYVTLSAAIVLFIIQISDILMQFFIRTLGVNELFRIFFVPGAKISGKVLNDSEAAYQTFQGCSNLKIDALESIRTSKFLIKFTNMTYYFIGIMFILRKVVLWMLLVIAPFLAILAPFVFIRNAGWIWVGVFFQWVFYGPLMALFLGTLARIWNSQQHIPFIFDFSRVQQMSTDYSKIIYPTTTNILYGGPAQKLQFHNTSSYVDTFAEYIIALIMLWTVIILPWWLLRIFRDYCCEGIMAMKNILLAMYDSLKTGGLGPPSPPVGGPTPTGTTGLARLLPREKEIKTTLNIESLREIKTMKTQDIIRPITVAATRITDIARVETNYDTRETVVKNINYIQNPMRAETPTERQKFMTIRSELYERATKGDTAAQQAVAAFSSTHTAQVQEKARILQTVPQAMPSVVTTSIKVGLSKEKTAKVVSSIFNAVANNETAVTHIAHETSISKEQVRSVLTTLGKTETMNVPAQAIVSKIAAETRLEKVKVESILQKTQAFFKETDVKTATTYALVHTFNIPIETVSVAVAALGPTADFANPTTEMVTQLSQQTNVAPDKIREVMANSVVIRDKQKEIMTTIAQEEGVEEAIVQNVISLHVPVVANELSQTTPISVATSVKSGVPQAKTVEIVSSLFNSLQANDTVINTISDTTSVSKEQVKTVLTQLSNTQNMSLPAQTLVSTIATVTRMDTARVIRILNKTGEFFVKTDTGVGASTTIDDDMIAPIARQSGVEEGVVRAVMNAHVEALTHPGEFVEDTITIPQTVSIEDYEEVKSMWIDQYEKGEVPLSESIVDRKDWINVDILTVTNILNKITSSDPELRSRGLDDVGLILPIFMINNMKGDELAVYLKAKLEAAKQVKREFEKQDEVRDSLQKEQGETYVDVALPKKAEAEKAMHMSEEMPTPPEAKTMGQQAVAARVKEEMRGDYQSAEKSQYDRNTAPVSTEQKKVDEIKGKLEGAIDTLDPKDSTK